MTYLRGEESWKALDIPRIKENVNAQNKKSIGQSP